MEENKFNKKCARNIYATFYFELALCRYIREYGK